MNKTYKLVLVGLVALTVVALLGWYLSQADIAVLSPEGVIAQKERSLIIWASLLSLLIVIPVFTMTFVIAWKYRQGNTKATYTPDWDHNRLAETIWWTVPTVLILVISVMNWNSSHQLDPFKPLASPNKPITVQVVALDWKWLFIYPEQNIASVNYLQFPKDTPVNFEITADAPMNSFWIPRLGGQIYAMPGMSTQLHLMANKNGSYRGSSANISGRGFASMQFVARSSSASDFKQWVNSVKQSPNYLSLAAYNGLAKPGETSQPLYYSSKEAGLYSKIITKYTGPAGQMAGMHMQVVDAR